MRDRFPAALGVGLLVAGAAALWLIRTSARSDFAERLSTYGAAPTGGRALYLLTQEAGLPVQREKHDLLVIPHDAVPVLLGINPSEARPVSPLDGGAAARAAADEGDEAAPDDPSHQDQDQEEDGDSGRDALADLFENHGLSPDEVKALLAHLRQGGTVVYAPWRAEQDTLLDEVHVRLEPTDKRQGVRTLVPAQPSPYTRGVEQVEAPVAAYLDLPDRAVPLLVDLRTLDPVAAAVDLGGGTLLVLGTPELATNAMLGRADNAKLWLSLLGAASRGRPLLFDEHHHGFIAERSIAEFAARHGLQFAVLQLLVGLCFWAASLRRLGAARPPEEEQRAMGAEALSASGRLYRAGKHRAWAARAIVDRLGEELARVAAVSPRATAAELIHGLERANRLDLSRAFTELRARAEACSSDADVQAIASLAAALRRTAFPTTLPPLRTPERTEELP